MESFQPAHRGDNMDSTNPRAERPDTFDAARPMKMDASAEMKLVVGIIESLQKVVQRCSGVKVRTPLDCHNPRATHNHRATQCSLWISNSHSLFHAWVLNVLPNRCVHHCRCLMGHHRSLSLLHNTLFIFLRPVESGYSQQRYRISLRNF
jgi:hypothetical protein